MTARQWMLTLLTFQISRKCLPGCPIFNFCPFFHKLGSNRIHCVYLYASKFDIKHFFLCQMLMSTYMFWFCFAISSIQPVISTHVRAFDLRMLSGFSSRYPVGYNPDNRTRPNYKTLPDLRTPDMWAGESACSPMLKPRPKWEPPVGYDPEKRKLAFVNLRTPKTDQVLETIHFQIQSK